MKITKILSVLCLVGTLTSLSAQTAKPKSSTPSKPSTPPASKPPAAESKVGKKDVRAVVTLTGYVKAKASSPVSVVPDAWADLTVEQTVPHGKHVKRGDTLLRFRTEKIEEQIASLLQGRKSRKLALANATDELKSLEKTTPINLENVKRSREEAHDDYKYYTDTDRKETVKDMEWMLKRSEFSLAYAKEELNQLLKMYEADDLTEETEEIIIDRARNQVESAERSHNSTTLYVDRYLDTFLPRMDLRNKRERESAELSYEFNKEALPRTLQLKREEVAKLQTADEKADKNLKELQSDLGKLTVKAPTDGIVYYGAEIDGRFATGATVAKKLIPGGKVAPREVFMTVVQPEAIQLYTVIPEDKISLVRRGSKGLATPVAHPMKKFEARVDRVDAAPRPAGGFGAYVTLGNLNGTKLLPGMSAKVTFVPVNEPGALNVPVQAVFQDNETGKPYVILLDEKKVPSKRNVAVGPTDGKVVVIRNGLEENDLVSTIPLEIPDKAKDEAGPKKKKRNVRKKKRDSKPDESKPKPEATKKPAEKKDGDKPKEKDQEKKAADNSPA